MNQKQAKRLRRNLCRAAEVNKVDFSADTHIRGLVPSKTYDATVNGETMEGTALQVRLAPESFRGMYQRVKRNVQANRAAKRAGVLSGV